MYPHTHVAHKRRWLSCWYVLKATTSWSLSPWPLRCLFQNGMPHGVAPHLVDHGYGGRPLRELDEVHGEDDDAAAAAAEAVKPMKATSDGLFPGENPLHSVLPLTILQICVIVVLTHGLAFLLRPLRQPCVIAEIIGGILLGPSVLGRSSTFPQHGVPLLEFQSFFDKISELLLVRKFSTSENSDQD